MCKKAVVRTAGKIHPLYEIGACSLYQMDRLFVDRGRYSFCLEVILLALTTHLMNAVESLGFRSKAYRIDERRIANTARPNTESR